MGFQGCRSPLSNGLLLRADEHAADFADEDCDDSRCVRRPAAAPGRAQQEDLNFLLTNRIPRPRRRGSSAGSAGSSSRWCAGSRSPSGGCSPTSTCAMRGAPTSAACTTASRANSSTARDRPTRTRRCWSAPATRSSAPADRSLDGQVLQAKGLPYTLRELFGGDDALAAGYRDGCYVTLRLTSAMYHRFHAPHDLRRRRTSPTSRATPGTSTRSRWRASSACSAATNAR